MNSGLSQEQSEALVNFQAITECWDSSNAQQMLRKHNWDVMAASNEYLAFFAESQAPSDYQTYQRPVPSVEEHPPVNQNIIVPQEAEASWSITSIIYNSAKYIKSKIGTVL